jgi:hypothetical protein
MSSKREFTPTAISGKEVSTPRNKPKRKTGKPSFKAKARTLEITLSAENPKIKNKNINIIIAQTSDKELINESNITSIKYYFLILQKDPKKVAIGIAIKTPILPTKEF